MVKSLNNYQNLIHGGSFMKRIVSLFMLSAVFFSCVLPVTPINDTGILSISVSEPVKSKTVVPDVSVDIVSFDITGTGPSTNFAVVDTGQAAHVQQDVEAGEWLIQVDAKNATGQVIAHGEAAVTVHMGQESVVAVPVSLALLSGNGTMNVDLSWTQNTISDPVVEATLQPVGGGAMRITFTLGDDSAYYQNSELAAGYYLLVADVLDGTVSRYTINESIRILEGSTTDAVYSLTVYDLLPDRVKVPSLSPDSLTAADSITVTMTPTTSGASVKYTTNGSAPTRSVGVLYTAPITVNTTTTIKAVSYKDGYGDSVVVTKDYLISGTVAVPHVSVAEGLHYEPQNVSLSCDTPATTILYTTDGSDPVYGSNGTVYAGPISVSSDTTIGALAYLTADTTAQSDTTSASYRITEYVADPVLSLASGEYDGVQTVTITCATAGAAIYYTLDGSMPSTVNGTEYTTAIEISQTSVLHVKATKPDCGDSNLASAEYTLKAADPTFSPSGGTFGADQSVILVSLTAGATIYYTLDESAPSAAHGTLYSDAIAVTRGTTIKAIAVKSGLDDSIVITEAYNLSVADPVVGIAAGSYLEPISVTLSTPTIGDTIIYTTDGTAPSVSNGMAYSSAIDISSDTTLQAVGTKSGWISSSVVSTVYSVGGDPVPVDGSSTKETTPLLEWTAGLDAAGYHIQINTAGDFTGTSIADDQNVGQNQYQIGTVLTKGTYYWRVRKQNGSGLWGDWTNTWSFLVGFTVEQKIVPSDGFADDRAGMDVDISGNHAIVSSIFDGDNGDDSGSVYFYQWDGTTWGNEQKITASDGTANDWFGNSVSIAGNVAVVGASEDDELGLRAGSAYFYRWDGTSWGGEQKIMASDGTAEDTFGYSVGISGDHAIVGAHGRNSSTGVVYMYHWDGTSWGDEQKITASVGAPGDLYGWEVGISGDKAIVTAQGDDDRAGNAGAVYVYRWNGSSWGGEQKITVSDASVNDNLGRSAGISGDKIIVGSWSDDDKATNAGAVYFFQWNGTIWGNEQKVLASDGVINNHFSDSVDISGDHAIVGAITDDRGTYSGSAYIYKWNGTSWSGEQKALASDGAANDLFGCGTAISDDHAVVGACFDDDNGADSGSVYFLR
jgi:hypothetical protein